MTPAREVTVIVPLSRPRFMRDVIENFARQTFARKRLVIVENGEAVGACAKAGFVPDVVLTSDAHQSAAKNVGLEWLRERGGGFFATMDDDDYFGPRYLEEAVAHSGRGDIIGKSACFTRTAGGVMRYFEHEGALQFVNYVHGPTIAAWAEFVDDFPLIAWGEDAAFIIAARKAGAKAWATSRFHFLQRRFPGRHHTWQITDRQMVQASAGLVFEVGPEDRDVVDGLKDAPQCAVIPKSERQPWDHPGWQMANGRLNME